VVHDLRNPEHSVVAISGHLTGRQVGAPVPDPQLLPGTVDKFTNDDLGRTARTPHGRELLASTAWVRDGDGHIVGALCINADLSGLREARELIDHHLGRESTETRPVSTFAVNVAELTRLAIASVLGPTRQGRLRKAERVELVRQLDAEGVFTLRHAAETVAAELGVSRSSVYGDLHAARLGRPGCPAPQQP
jgi:predicted transcriptional regulator YheO